jgi:hypothetical protein
MDSIGSGKPTDTHGEGRRQCSPLLLPNFNRQDASAVIERLNKLFHDNKKAYTKFLAHRGNSAQWLLEVLQDVSWARFLRKRLGSVLTERLPDLGLRVISCDDK